MPHARLPRDTCTRTAPPGRGHRPARNENAPRDVANSRSDVRALGGLLPRGRPALRRAHRVRRLLRRGLVRGPVRRRLLVVREGRPVLPGIGEIWQILGLGKDKTPERCGIPQEPSEGTDGSFGAIGNKEQKRRWEEAKEIGDCRPLFTSQAKCEDYWGRWQKAWSAEWGGACIARLLSNAALLFYGFSFFSEIGPDILFFCLLTR